MQKDYFFKQAKAVRSFENRIFLNSGTISTHGGVDGEMSPSCFWKVLQEIIRRKSGSFDRKSYGCDIGHGSGVACMAYFGGGPIPMNMIGFECNENRYNYSVTVQKAMLLHPTKENFRAMAKSSQFYFGDAVAGLIATLGTSGLNIYLQLIYWFKEGWSPVDIESVVKYANNFLAGLEFFVGDMSWEELLSYGFDFELLSSSTPISGMLVKSTNSRTLHIHHVRSKQSKPKDLVCTEMEEAILEKFADSYSTIDGLSVNIENFWERHDDSKQARNHDAVLRKRQIDEAFNLSLYSSLKRSKTSQVLKSGRTPCAHKAPPAQATIARRPSRRTEKAPAVKSGRTHRAHKSPQAAQATIARRPSRRTEKAPVLKSGSVPKALQARHVTNTRRLPLRGTETIPAVKSGRTPRAGKALQVQATIARSPLRRTETAPVLKSGIVPKALQARHMTTTRRLPLRGTETIPAVKSVRTPRVGKALQVQATIAPPLCGTETTLAVKLGTKIRSIVAVKAHVTIHPSLTLKLVTVPEGSSSRNKTSLKRQLVLERKEEKRLMHEYLLRLMEEKEATFILGLELLTA